MDNNTEININQRGEEEEENTISNLNSISMIGEEKENVNDNTENNSELY